MINVIFASLGLDLVIVNVHANVYQNIPNGLRVISRTVRGIANSPWTDRCDYRSHSESQPSASLSVDFLRVVQSAELMIDKHVFGLFFHAYSNDAISKLKEFFIYAFQ